MRRCRRSAFPATRPPRLAILCSTVTHLSTENHPILHTIVGERHGESGIRQSAHRSSGDRSASRIRAPRVPVCPAARPTTSIESNAGDVKWPNRSTRIAAASWALRP
jgi:hypothetical protein